ncbi:hypothetical protein B0H10DRAFT_1953164 [Mycena sp. CBHHK59/15]|nr:hypothetical protein B0H10DRAFT_1953164 [Mycena sp. CBHHK59/15]
MSFQKQKVLDKTFDIAWTKKAVKATKAKPPSRVNGSPIAGPSRLPESDLISRPQKLRVREPSSDFNYEAALKLDLLDTTLRHIAYGTSDPIDIPMYPVGDPDNDILASDPHTPS